MDQQRIRQIQELWDQDFDRWLHETGDYVREALPQSDALKLLEFLQEMSGKERSALESQLTRLIAHLLKGRYSAKVSSSWERTCSDARNQINAILMGSPSLAKSYLDDLLVKPSLFARAKKWAEAEMKTTLPDQTNPFSKEQLFDIGFFGQSN